MHIPARQWIWVLLVGLTQILEIIYTPHMQSLATHFQVHISDMGQSVSLYVYGVACGYPLWGYLSDRLGRLMVFKYALMVLLFLPVCMTLTSSFPLFLALRFCAGFCAASLSLMPQVMARDVLRGPQRLAFFAKLGIIIGLVPILANYSGAILYAFWGWQGFFYGSTLAVALALVFVLLKGEETCPTPTPISFQETKKSLISDSLFHRGCVMMLLMVSVAFISFENMPQLMAQMAGKNSLLTQNIGLFMGLPYIGGAALNYVPFVQAHHHFMVLFCFGAMVLITAFTGLFLQFVPPLFYPLKAATLLVMIGFVFFGMGFIKPPVASNALRNMQKIMGVAGAFFACFYYMGAALMLTLFNALLAISPTILPSFLLGATCLLYLAYHKSILEMEDK